MLHALRLRPGDELKSGIERFCEERGLNSAVIVSCVGSLEGCILRLANADREHPNEIKTCTGRFEIVSLVGTVCGDGSHVHAGLADSTGKCVGGHLIEATVFTTAEIVVANVDATFRRELDPATGFPELVASGK
ncbi:hypothetical protein M885DRAFT_582652 [Pelagophyceae sp. CCMP2097]|nr:hypothetical protein M885DRAFT_582652 [Pelagophyceae sp. CCMP2097]